MGVPLIYNIPADRQGNLAIDAHPTIAGRYVIIYHVAAGAYALLKGRLLQVANAGTGTTVATLGSEFSVASNASFAQGATDYFNVSWVGGGTDKLVVAYVAHGVGQAYYVCGQPNAVVVDASNTGNITVGTTIAFGTTDSRSVSSHVDPFDANSILVTYMDVNNGNYTTGVILTRNNNTLTSGTPTVLASIQDLYPRFAFDPTTQGRFAVLNNRGGLKIILGNKSGSTLTTSAPHTIFSRWVHESADIRFDPNLTGRIAVVHDDDGLGQNVILADVFNGAVVGTTTIQTTTLASCKYNAIDFDSNRPGSFILAYGQDTAQDLHYARAGEAGSQSVQLTADNFVGVSTAAYADTATASITLQGGLSTNQTGLTAGSTYYVRTDATLSSTAGSPSVTAGKALSATKLLLKGI